MAKNNPCDVLTWDWNPIVGCERYSEGCRNCWFIEGIFPWQQRLGNLPAGARPEDNLILTNRLTVEYLKTKRGIIGVVQHGDLFADMVSDKDIIKVLDIIEERRANSNNWRRDNYLFWTKRAERATRILYEYYHGIWNGDVGLAISVENQEAVEERLPFLAQKWGGLNVVVAEPLLESIDISPYIDLINWLIVGSETGKYARPMMPNWVVPLRDLAVNNGIPFFLKQVGKNHKKPIRGLYGRTWDEFPPGWVK